MEKQSAQSDFWLDQISAQNVMRQLAEQKKVVQRWRELEKKVADIAELILLAVEERDASLEAEIQSEVETVAAYLDELEFELGLVPLEGLVESLRAIKEPEEIELIARAAALSDNAFEHIEGAIRSGMSEKEVAWEIERFLREQGSQAIPFDIIVASGPNSALPHARPSTRIIESGEPVLVDIGAKVEGYSSDLSRTICSGSPDSTFNKVYQAVLAAQSAAVTQIEERMTGEQADSFARTVIARTGYGDAFGHSLGHGIGLAPHESPRLGPNSTDELASGMVFTIEPGIYLTGWGGVRIEDTVVMENGKIKLISKAGKIGVSYD